jgi:hypothetical protein
MPLLYIVIRAISLEFSLWQFLLGLAADLRHMRRYGDYSTISSL